MVYSSQLRVAIVLGLRCSASLLLCADWWPILVIEKQDGGPNVISSL
jgi:hypothetical protein